MNDRAANAADKRRAFRALHAQGCFVIPNPWDIGTARYLQHLGFKALASTSAGFAFSRGLPDGGVARDAMLAHVAEIVAASDLPVNADFESGYAPTPQGVAESVRLCAETGVAGLSIEDATGDRDRPLYDIGDAVARIAAARAAIDRAGADVMLTGRAECFLVGRPDIDEALRRLKAYAGAGADCLYAPGLRSREHIAAVIDALAPKPVNVLMPAPLGLVVADLAALGARRVSVGGALMRVAFGAFMRSARQIAQEGRFDTFADAAPHAEVTGFFRDDLHRRA
ncbi:MAG: isocitrate lyase/phosphoenolpyruvate mutase family protein [Proteobacteria bacterium]|nr:isocitrate lyase/phosphoenolpyruvate mutase family protein [Pseudomonadota bacterium]